MRPAVSSTPSSGDCVEVYGQQFCPPFEVAGVFPQGWTPGDPTEVFGGTTSVAVILSDDS